MEETPYLRRIFKSADLNGDDLLDIYEFLTVYRHIEPDLFNEIEDRITFFSEADATTKDVGNPALTRIKFAAITIRDQLFQPERVNQFIRNITKSVPEFILMTSSVSMCIGSNPECE